MAEGQIIDQVGPVVATLLYFIVSGIIVLLGLWVFKMITKYNDWEEIKQGNYAVALSVGGKIVGMSLILMFSILENGTLWGTILWGAFGAALQIIVYFLYDILTRSFSVQEQLQEKNIAVGIIAFCVSTGAGLVIGASIT